MSTRRLIITALACGMAILLAGGVFLVRVANSRDDRTITIHRVGDVVRVGQLAVVVGGVTESVDAVQVRVSIDARAADLARPADAEAPWTLLIGSPRPRRVPTGDTPCRGAEIAAGQVLECDVAFEAGDGTPFLAFDFGGVGARWRLD